MVNYNSWESPYRLDKQHGDGHSPDIADTLRSLKVEIRSYKADNDRIIQAHEKQAKVIAIILQSLSDLQWQGPHPVNYEQEDRTNGAYGSRFLGGHMSNRYGRLLDNPKRRRDRHKYYSSFDSYRHYDRHHYHPYRRIDRGYLSDEFKKEKPPTFDGEMKKP